MGTGTCLILPYPPIDSIPRGTPSTVSDSRPRGTGSVGLACACPHLLFPAPQQARRSAVAPALCRRSFLPQSSAGGPAELQRSGGSTLAGHASSQPVRRGPELEEKRSEEGRARSRSSSREAEAPVGTRKPRLIRFYDGDVRPSRIQPPRLTPKNHPQHNRDALQTTSAKSVLQPASPAALIRSRNADACGVLINNHCGCQDRGGQGGGGGEG